VNNVPLAVFHSPHAMVLTIHSALLCAQPAIVFGHSMAASHHHWILLSCPHPINDAGALSTMLLNPPPIEV
jgi:hypothetical protein